MKRILLAYDGTEPARRALETAADLAKKYEASVTVVSVVPVHPGRAPMDPWDDVEVHDAQLHEADLALRALGIEAKLLEPAGRPGIDHRAGRRQGRLRHDRHRSPGPRHDRADAAGQRVGARRDTRRDRRRHRSLKRPEGDGRRGVAGRDGLHAIV